MVKRKYSKKKSIGLKIIELAINLHKAVSFGLSGFEYFKTGVQISV